MPVKVILPTALRGFTGSADVCVEAATVRSALEQIASQHPALKSRLFDDAGKLRRYVNVFIGEKNVRNLAGLDTELTEGAEVAIIPSVAGGA